MWVNRKNIAYEGKYKKKNAIKNIIHQLQELLQIHCVNIPSLNYTNIVTVIYQET